MHLTKEDVMRATTVSAMAIRMPLEFPREFQKGLSKSIDRRYWTIFAVCLTAGMGMLALEMRNHRPLDLQVDYIVRRIPATRVNIDVKELEPLKTVKKEEEPIFRRLESMNAQQRRIAFQEYLRQQAQNRQAEIANRLNERFNQMQNMMQNSGSRFGVLSANHSTGTYTYSSNEISMENSQREIANEQLRNGQITINVETENRHIASNLNLQTGQNLITLTTPRLDRQASASGLSSADVMNVISQNELTIQAIYTRYLNQQPDLKGKVSVRISFDKSGRVVNVQIEQNTTGNAAFEREIVSKIRGWRFPSTTQRRGTVTVGQTFIFGK